MKQIGCALQAQTRPARERRRLVVVVKTSGEQRRNAPKHIQRYMH